MYQWWFVTVPNFIADLATNVVPFVIGFVVTPAFIIIFHAFREFRRREIDSVMRSISDHQAVVEHAQRYFATHPYSSSFDVNWSIAAGAEPPSITADRDVAEALVLVGALASYTLPRPITVPAVDPDFRELHFDDDADG